MVREAGSTPMVSSSIDQVAVSLGSDEGIHLSDAEMQRKQSIDSDTIPSNFQPRSSLTDDESGYSDATSTSTPTRASPTNVSVVSIPADQDYELASNITDDNKKEFCSDMCLVFHAEFQLTFGRYFTSDQWILMPLHTDGVCKLPSDALCNVQIAKVRFECDACGHCWTSMRGQVSFFYDTQSHVLYFKLFTQNCDRCRHLCSPLWYPEEVCRVIRNVFVTIAKDLYPELQTPIAPNHYRRFGNPKGQHHGCESCRDGVCVALAAQELGCKLVK
jgi:hypothetical protein